MRFLNSLKKRVRSSSTDAGVKGGKGAPGSFQGSIHSGSNPDDSLHGSTWPSEAFPLYNIPSVSGTFSCDDRSVMSYDDDGGSVRSGSSFRSTGSASSRGSMVYYYDAKTGKTRLTSQNSYGRDRIDEMVNQSLTPRQLRERRRQKRREALQRESREKQKHKIRAAAQAAARRDSMSMYSGGSFSTGSGSGRSKPRRRDSFSSISTTDSSRDVSSMNWEGGNSGHSRSLLGSWFSSSKSNSTATTVGTATEQSSSSNISSLGDWSSAVSADDMFSLDEALDEDENGSTTDTAHDDNNSYYDGTNGYHDGGGEDTSVCTIGTNYSSSYYNGSNNVHPAPELELLGTTPPRSNTFKKFYEKEQEQKIRGEDVEEHNFQRLQFQRYQEEDRRYQELQKQKRMQQQHQVSKPDDDEEDFEQLQRRLQQQRDQYHQRREAAAATAGPQQEQYDHQEQRQWQQQPLQLEQAQHRYNKPALITGDTDDRSSRRQKHQERSHHRSHPKCSNNHKCYELGAVYGKVKSGKALQQYVLQQLRLQQVQHQQQYGVNTTGVADECDEELHEKQRRLVKRWKNMHCRECRVKIGVPSSCFHELQRQQYGVGSTSHSDHESFSATLGGDMMADASASSAHRGKLPTSRKPVFVCLSCHYRAVCSSCWNRRVSNSK